MCKSFLASTRHLFCVKLLRSAKFPAAGVCHFAKLDMLKVIDKCMCCCSIVEWHMHGHLVDIVFSGEA